MSFENHGRAGWVYYKEQFEIRFPWEISGVTGIIITIPSPQEWAEFCRKNNAAWALERRDEIIDTLARETARKRYWNGKFEIGDYWINVFPGPSIFVRMLERIFLKQR